jgi:hypothetical protein
VGTGGNFVPLLVVLSWFALAVLITLMLLIARFYQNVSREKTHFRLFFVPLVLYGGASLRYAFLGRVGSDPLADLLTFIGGVVLAVMCIHLYNLMTTGR